MLRTVHMRRTQRTVLRCSLSALALSTTALAVAQPAPSGAHPRIWLDSATKSGLAAQAGIANSPVARGAKRCAAARNDPSDYAVGGWQGFEFVTTLSGCLVSWAATGSADDLTTAIKYWNVLLDDYQQVGDGAGGDDVVTHDTGYAMRTFAPYSALAYDWLHDAPGVTESLRAHARARFDAWMSFYSTSGYLRSMPGANYQAGYLFAATLIAIAEGGEAGAAGDAHWATVRDTIWGRDMAAALAPGGVLEGGDWPEGWQYGPLSVLEYSLAARALEENGAPVNGVEQWGSSLVSRFAHGLLPGQQLSFVAGDTDAETANRAPNNGALLAAIVGPASSSAKAWARKLNTDLGLLNENPLFDAIALASSGPAEAPAADLATNHLAKGSGNWYVRGGWHNETAWTVFQCSRRLVDDHQHNDAGNFVLARGADDVVVDPSPYGTLSTLTSNAPAVDSAAMPEGYSPSQGNWGEKTELVWARQSASGIASARCNYADQFRRNGSESDVPHALRDFVFIPDGADGSIVLVDRVVTGDASRGLHLRVRTPGDLGLSGSTASASVGGSALAVERVFSNSGEPTVRTMPQASECPSSDRQCDISRLPEGTEYRLDVAGPSAFAIHVVSGRAADAAAVTSQSLAGNGFRGVIHGSGSSAVAVITNDTPDGALASSLVYQVPAGTGLAHVVVDAPVNADQKSNVTAVRDGSNCRIEVTPANGSGTSFDGRPLVVRTSSDCALSDDGTRAPVTPGTPGGEEMPGVDPEDSGSAGSGSLGEGGSGDSEPNGKGGTRANGGSGGTKASGSAGSPGASAGTSSVLGGNPTGTGGASTETPARPSTPALSGCSAAPEGGRHNPFGPLAAALVGLALVARQRRHAKRGIVADQS
jgi:MYXO-CTERM domain-containing protein